MDSSVTPTSPSEMAILVAGLLIMLLGVYKVYRERGRPGLLILWGGLVDLGLALMGLGLGPSGDVGSIMIVIYHAIARLAAWIGLSGLVANPYSCVANDIRGALHRNPVGAVLLAFALEASLGISPAMTPEGQHLVLHAMAMHSIDVPLGGPVLAIIMALGYTVLLWLSAEVVLQVCFTRPDEPICTDVPLGGGGFARALFDQETELLGVPSGSWCPIVPNRWSKTPAAISLYVLLGMLVVLGLGRFFVQDFGAWLIGIDPHTLVELEGPWHVTPLLLYVGSFLVLCPRIIRPAYRAKYTFALFLAAFILIYASDLPPLSRLFSLIISGIGTLVACYSTNYIEEDGRKHWYWFFLLLTFGALLNIVTTDNIGTLASQWEVMTWASFALVAWERTSKARDAAIKYVVLCCSAAYLMIVGFFMIGGNHTQYGEIVANLAVHSDDVLKFALVFTLLGFAAKAGLVPLHSWLPDAHPAAPSSVSAPLSGVLTKMGVFGVVTVYFGLIGYKELASTGTYGGLTAPGLMVTFMGLCTMAYGEWMALRQEDLKRMLAYSTMGQVGEIFTVLGLGTWLAAAGALSHVLNHAIMKDLLFLCAGGLIFRVGSRKLSDLAGLVHEMPWAVGCMSIGIVSIMGLPPFNGFVSKYLMIVACMDAGQPLIAAALIAASLVGAIYYMRILRTILLDPAPAGRRRDHARPHDHPRGPVRAPRRGPADGPVARHPGHQRAYAAPRLRRGAPFGRPAVARRRLARVCDPAHDRRRRADLVPQGPREGRMGRRRHPVPDHPARARVRAGSGHAVLHHGPVHPRHRHGEPRVRRGLHGAQPYAVALLRLLPAHDGRAARRGGEFGSVQLLHLLGNHELVGPVFRHRA